MLVASLFVYVRVTVLHEVVARYEKGKVLPLHVPHAVQKTQIHTS